MEVVIVEGENVVVRGAENFSNLLMKIRCESNVYESFIVEVMKLDGNIRWEVNLHPRWNTTDDLCICLEEWLNGARRATNDDKNVEGPFMN